MGAPPSDGLHVTSWIDRHGVLRGEAILIVDGLELDRGRLSVRPSGTHEELEVQAQMWASQRLLPERREEHTRYIPLEDL